MKALHRERLLKLATHLMRGKLGHKEFAFNWWNADENHVQLDTNGCGFCGCAIGEAPFAFPSHWEFKDGYPVCKKSTYEETRYDQPFSDAQDFFNLTVEEAEHLFVPLRQQPLKYGGKEAGRSATRQEVAQNIRAFVRKFSRKGKK